MKITKPAPAMTSSQQGWMGMFMDFLGLRSQRRRGALLEKLQFQRFLLKSGLDATAHVLGVESKGSAINDLQEINLLLSIHKPGQGAVELIRTTSVVGSHHVPQTGDKISIRYIPGDTSALLIL